MLILVLNPGSSSVKYQVRHMGESGTKPRILHSHVASTPHGGGLDPVSLDGLFDGVEAVTGSFASGTRLDGIGHRVVHGGQLYRAPVRVTRDVIQAIEDLDELAPLHNAASAGYMRAAHARWPDTPQVAVFDTAFHRTMPDFASHYAVPENLSVKYGILRYGFHGISVEMACRNTAAFLGIPVPSLNIVVAHLGSGASVTAIKMGRSVDTSMGMTPLAGLVMGTRSGDVDPSVITFLQRRGLGRDEVDELLNRGSGLQGLTGSADMRDVLEAAQRGEAQAVLAADMAAYRLAKYIAAYNMAVGGASALVFTGGVGEHSASFRSRVVSLLGPLGLSLDHRKNGIDDGTIRTISATQSAFPLLVVPCDEERAIAEATAAFLAPGNKTGGSLND